MNNMQKNISKKLKKKSGFTLIEMLIVVAIIAILVVVSIPLVTTSLDKAKQATDEANVRAAKATAVMEYLGNEKDLTDPKTPYYYDIENGKLDTEKPAGYNQSDLTWTGGTAVEEETMVIKVTVTAPEADSTDGPTITCTWEAEA